jgi:hypothetical protein
VTRECAPQRNLPLRSHQGGEWRKSYECRLAVDTHPTMQTLMEEAIALLLARPNR